jgi:hypothetical protein
VSITVDEYLHRRVACKEQLLVVLGWDRIVRNDCHKVSLGWNNGDGVSVPVAGSFYANAFSGNAR